MTTRRSFLGALLGLPAAAAGASAAAQASVEPQTTVTFVGAKFTAPVEASCGANSAFVKAMRTEVKRKIAKIHADQLQVKSLTDKLLADRL